MINTKIFLNNLIILGDSCSGKTSFSKIINFKKIDFDYLIKSKLIIFKNEFFFRKIEKILFLINLKQYILILGGGCVNYCFTFNNIIFYKYVNIYTQIIRLFKDCLNRPMFDNVKNFKIRYSLRKKFYLKLSDIYINCCFYCFFKKINDIVEIKKK